MKRMKYDVYRVNYDKLDSVNRISLIITPIHRAIPGYTPTTVAQVSIPWGSWATIIYIENKKTQDA